MTRFTTPTVTSRAVRILPKPEKPVQPIERTGFSIDEAAESLGVSKSIIVPLVKDGTIRSVRIGRRIVISVQSLRKFVDGSTDNADNDGIACVAERKEANEWQH